MYGQWVGGGETHCYSLSSMHSVDRWAALTEWHTGITGVVVTALETTGQPDLFTADEDFFFLYFHQTHSEFLWRTTVSFHFKCCHIEWFYKTHNPATTVLGGATETGCVCVWETGAAVVGKSRSAVISTWGRIFVCDLQHKSLSQTPHKLGYLNFTLHVCVLGMIEQVL